MAIVVTSTLREGAQPTCLKDNVQGNLDGFCFRDYVPVTLTGNPETGRPEGAPLAPTQETTAPSITRPAEQTNPTLPSSQQTSTVNPGASPAGNSAITTPTAPTNQKSTASSGVTGGAVAGVAIGCLIAGAAIATLILFLLRRRRRSSQPAFYGQQHLPQNNPHIVEKTGIVTTAPVGGRVASNVDHMLPPPAEDAAITQTLSKLRDNIKNHVKSYYHTDPVPATAMKESMVSELAALTGLRPSTLLGMFVNPSTRQAAIRLYIGWVATTRCSGDRYPSLLPDEIARLTVNMPGRDNKNKDQTALLSKWKVITGALLQQRFGQTVTDGDSRAGAIAEAINQIDTALAPFIARDIDIEHRRRNLEMIMGRSAQLAYLLFSQPGSFRFDLGNPGARNSLVVFPALFQTVNDQGQLLAPPRLLCEKEDVNI
jgi:hypothetical protein